MGPEGSTDPGTWTRVDQAFQAALEQPAATRRDWVRTTFHEQPALRDAVLELLASEASSERYFDEALQARDAIAAAAAGAAPVGIDLVGTRLGPYRLEALVATGGMGAVYRAERVDGEFQQTVAIKILPGWATDPQTVSRLRAERQILSSLQHPNITQLLDGGQTGDGFPYLVTAFIEGDSITAYAARERLDLDARLDLFLAVADAVQYAHEQGVIHRDIKPANVLVDRLGRPQLLDFGIARLTGDALGDVTRLRTATGFTPMTPEYASPEQLAGADVGIASDIYQLGLLLYRLVTGARLPADAVAAHGGVTRPSTAVRRDGEKVTLREGMAPDRLARALRGDLDTIILKALRPEPAARYRSVRALARDLRHHRAGEAIEARPESPWSATRRLARHYPVAAALAVSLLAVLVIWAASLSFYTRELERQRDEAERQAVRATQARDVLIDVFRRSDPLQGDTVGGRDASVWDTLAAAEEEARETLADDPEVLAELLSTLAVLQGYAGDPERRLALLEESTALYAKLGPGFTTQYAVQLAELANQLTVSDAERAVRLRDEASGLLPGVEAVDPLAAAVMLIDIGVIDFEYGAFDASLAACDEVLALLDRVAAEEWSMRIEAHFGRGKALIALERLDEAAAALETSLVLTREHFAEDHGRLTGTLSALATLEGRLGNQEASIAWAEQLVAIMSRNNAPEYSSLLSARNNLALAYGRVGRHAEQQAMLEDIIRIRRGQAGPDGDRNLAVSLKNLASSLHATGDFAAARNAVLEARTLMDRHYPAGSPVTATPWFTLGLIELDDGDAGVAENAFRQTLAILEPALGGGHVQVHITKCFLAESLRRGDDRAAALALAGPALSGIETAPSANEYYAERCRQTDAALAGRDVARSGEP